MTIISNVKEVVKEKCGPIASLVFIAIVILIIPAMVLFGLSLIGVEIDWLSPWTWIGGVILTVVLG